jgi:hypothetical protein
MFEEDDPVEPQPSHQRLWVLISALVVTVAASGVGLWWVFRPRPSPPPVSAVERDPIDLQVAERDAKKLPEFVELRGNITRPATDEEITRIIELSRHPNAWIRVLARSRLSKVIDGPRRADAVSAVAAGLREESMAMRLASMDLLASMKAREYEGELRVFLASPDEGERGAARHALERMGLPVE